MPALVLVPFVAGQTLTAGNLNAAFNAVKTLLETTKLGTDNLQATYDLQRFDATVSDMALGVSRAFHMEVATAAAIPLAVHVSYDTEAAPSSVTCDLVDKSTGLSALTAGSFAVAAAETVEKRTAFNVGTFPVGRHLELIVTAGAAAVTGVTVTFIYKTIHQA